MLYHVVPRRRVGLRSWAAALLIAAAMVPFRLEAQATEPAPNAATTTQVASPPATTRLPSDQPASPKVMRGP